MNSFIKQAQLYAACHQKSTTLYTHFAGVPVIILSVMILLGFVKIIIPGVFATNLACLGTLAALIYYYRLQWQLSLALTPILFILLWIANWISLTGPTKAGVWTFIILFLIGWGLQLYGHYVEGKKPAFMDNIWQAFMAPLFVMAELFFMAGFMPKLKEKIHGAAEKGSRK